jgi:hypothetical protein
MRSGLTADVIVRLRLTDTVEKLCFRRPVKIWRAARLRIEKRFGGTRKLRCKQPETTVAALRWHRAPIFAHNGIWTNFCGTLFSEFFNSIDPYRTSPGSREAHG